MKFILFNINNTNKNVVNKIELDNNHYINEVSLSKTKLEQRLNGNPKFIEKIKNNLYDKRLDKIILKALDSYDNKWYYVLSNKIPNINYLSNKLEGLLGYKLTTTSELDNNIFKYVDEHLSESKNNKLKKHEVKVLLVATSNKNLNFSLITNLIGQYKNVNIYLKEKPSSYTLKRIKQINKDEGTTIEIVKKERKSFTEYNMVYFVDDTRENYPRLRLDKNALVIDESLSKNDKYNSNIIFINEYLSNNEKNRSCVENLMNEYGSLEIAMAIRKIVNELDKS